MRRDPRRLKVVPRCDALEPRALLSSDGLSAAGLDASNPDLNPPASFSPLSATIAPMPASSTSPVIVAVIDSGVNLTSTDPIHVTNNGQNFDLTDAYNAVNGELGQSAVADSTPNKRGTRVANELLQGASDAVKAGGSSNIQVLPISVVDPTTGGSPFYALVGAIYHAADFGARVIDVHAFPSGNDLDPGQIQQLDQAIAYAQSKNAVVVVPAGDGYGAAPANGSSPVGVNIDQAGTVRNVYLADPHLSNMLVVTATDASGNLAGSSNWGPTHVDVGVPTGAGDRLSGYATGYASGVAAVIAATRTDLTRPASSTGSRRPSSPRAPWPAR